MINIFLLILSAVIQAFAVAVMKKASTHPKRFLLLAITFLLFGASFPLYAIGLSGIDLAIAQPVFSASIFISTIALSALLFREKVNLQRITGVAVIIAGIITVIAK